MANMEQLGSIRPLLCKPDEAPSLLHEHNTSDLLAAIELSPYWDLATKEEQASIQLDPLLYLNQYPEIWTKYPNYWTIYDFSFLQA